MTPKYAVGEEVILCSVSYPRYNGPQVVGMVIVGNKRWKCRISGDICYTNDDGIGYVMEDSLPDDDGRDSVWCETSLRKKHKPADESFTQMIDRLNKETA